MPEPAFTDQQTAKLNVPKVPVKAYQRNALKTAVCELRFPTLLELEERGPTALQKRLRKAYPIYEPGSSVKFGFNEPAIHQERRFLFRTRRRDWTVAFHASSIALETSAYTTIDDFIRRLRIVLKEATPLIDSDFFTRVGLRYVNALPVGQRPQGWLNSTLIGPLERGIYGTTGRYWQQVAGYLDNGRYTFQHGYDDGAKAEAPEYVLDFDFYDENVEAEGVIEKVLEWNAQCYQFFEWAIGDNARAYLDATPRISISDGTR